MSDKILLVFGVGNAIYATNVQFREGTIENVLILHKINVQVRIASFQLSFKTYT